MSVPAHWHAGLQARIEWKYDSEQGAPSDPAIHGVTVDVPEYREPGAFQVHFDEGGEVRVVVSPCSIEHPFHPMSAAEKWPG